MKKRIKAHQPQNRLIGYARVSTREQTLDMQIDALKELGVHDDNLWVEKVSGAAAKRPERDKALIDAREGDTFIVWRLDRIGRKIMEVYAIVEGLRERGVTFKSIKENFDLSTATGKFMFGATALFAEFERNVTIERTQSGMAAAKRRGRHAGAQPKLTPAQWKKAEAMLASGKSPTDVAARFKVSRQTVYVRYNAEAIEKLRADAGYYDET